MKKVIKKGSYGKGNGSKNSEFVRIRGVCSYARTYKPDDYKGDLRWKINMHLDEEEKKRVKDMGIQLKWRDPNEEWSGVPGGFFTFNRPAQREFESGMTYFKPPEIFAEDGEPMVTYEETDEGFVQDGESVMIGNGSEVEIGCTLYDTKRFGKGVRWVNVRVIDLIEYIPDEEVTESEVDVEDGDDTPFDSNESALDVDDLDEPPKAMVRKPAPKKAPAKSRKKVAW